MNKENNKEMQNLLIYHFHQIQDQLQILSDHKQRILLKQMEECQNIKNEVINFQRRNEFYKQQTQEVVVDITNQLKYTNETSSKYYQEQAQNLDRQIEQAQKQFDKLAIIQQLVEKRLNTQQRVKEMKVQHQYLTEQLKHTKSNIEEKLNFQNTLEFNISQHQKVMKHTYQEVNKIFIEKIRDVEQAKRYWNNQLQDAKGSIRVYCRIRPNDENQEQENIQVTGECSLCIKVPEKLLKSGNYQKENYFNFERVFPQDADQDDIYRELSDLIQNVVDGHNVCVFAYGQTGSGKTYTMQGTELNQRGVIPRAIEQIFKEVKQMNELGWQMQTKVGFQEIYNETIKDMISNQRSEDIQLFQVNSMKEVEQLFNKAKENRQVAETQSNEFSSRSHFIFQLNIIGNCGEKQINSTLNLVDLAGSERANVAKTEGDRFIETKNINKSLSALGDVFNALYNKHQYVPFRNNKLTFVLQKYLEGTSKTLMMVNITSRVDDFQQTIASLRFAEKVKSCKMQINQQQQMKK